MKGYPVAASLALTLTLAVAGCGGNLDSSPGMGEADCTPEVRFDGVLYRSAGYTDQSPAERLGSADHAECHDEGQAAEGSVFSDKPQQVAVWTFEDYSPEEVVGVRFDEDSFSVFVAESTSGDRVDQITNSLISAG